MKLFQDAEAKLGKNCSAVYALLQALVKNVAVAATPIPSKPPAADPNAELAGKNRAMSNKELFQAAQNLSAEIQASDRHCNGYLDEMNTQKNSLSTRNLNGSARDRAETNITDNGESH